MASLQIPSLRDAKWEVLDVLGQRRVRHAAGAQGSPEPYCSPRPPSHWSLRTRSSRARETPWWASRLPVCSLAVCAARRGLRRRLQGTCLAAMVSPVTTVEPSDDVVPHEDMDELDDQMATAPLGKPLPWLQKFLPQSFATRRVDGSEAVEASDGLLLRFMEALEERGVELYPAQEEAIVEIFSGAHVVLDTPTGSGKSLVAVAALFKALGEGAKGGHRGRAYYTSPTKALTSEKFFDLCRHFGAKNVGMATGDVAINTRAPLICCTAEVLTSISLRDSGEAIWTVVMDEFHYFGDPDRGAAWELPLWRLSRPGCRTNFLLMSGTLGSNPKLYQTLQDRSGRPVRVVSSTVRPVPLQFSYSEDSVQSSIGQLVQTQRAPIYVVHFSQREALETAKKMADAQTSDGTPVLASALQDPAALRERVEAAHFSSPFGVELRELLLRGVGVHHAGLLPCYRRLVEQLTQDSLLALVCGTDTLGVGINVPIRSVLFTRLCKFDGEETRIMRSREFHQIAGRAGRKGFDDRGYVVAVDPDWIIHNRELQQQISSASSSGARPPSPRWRRPPRRNYQHWTQKTFTQLQRSAPDPLRSQFRLSMAQVLSVLQSAAEQGSKGEEELEDLIAAAQCSRGARHFWRRQVKVYMEALRRYIDFESLDQVADPAERSATIPLDDGTLFISEVVPSLSAKLSEEDLPLVVLAAAEAICDASETFLRALPQASRGEEAPGRCPRDIEELLFEVFNDFRRRRPWISPQFLRPKGIALELLSCESYKELQDRLPNLPEGTLLRYLSDVYRALRLGMPDEMKTTGLRQVENRLRQTVLQADSSLISEWEALKNFEKNIEALDSIEVLEDIEIDAGDLKGGSMVPATSRDVARRSREELQQRLQMVQRHLLQQHAEREAEEIQRQRGLLQRAKRGTMRLLAAADEIWQKLLGLVW
ncbi:Uncharacterized helicase C17H9.02 [Durusdinium trenchii]|uniref:Uncharacterized helicase C17H9.02 n=1 Tax=Durusdinium trenchii TaxID=1381693 RepID=A0ABP0KYB0_9DINO